MTVKAKQTAFTSDETRPSKQETILPKRYQQATAISLREVARVLDATVYTGQDLLHITVQTACCSDLMSDVLAFVHEKSVILTGIANTHVIRTAEMLDLKCIVFVRGKLPAQDVIDLAAELGVVLMGVNKTMFTSAGMLYERGLRGAPMLWASREGLGQTP